MLAVTELLVQTQSCYAGIYDEASAVNVPNFLASALKASDEYVRTKGMDDCDALFILNGRLFDCAKKGELLSWIALADGVFRAVIEIQPPLDVAADNAAEIESLGALAGTADLICPSGRLIIGCLGSVGEPQPCAVEVGSGTHRVCFTSDLDEEAKHYFLETPADYPRGEGPDWKITIRRVLAPHGVLRDV